MAVRTINKINIPLPFSDFDDYLTIMPSIPKALPQIFTGLFSQINVPATADNTKDVVINQTFDARQITETIVPYVLDIDVIHQ